jgi:hypothetical protein
MKDSDGETSESSEESYREAPPTPAKIVNFPLNPPIHNNIK